MKPTGIYERVQFLESRLDRMEVIILEQDKMLRALGVEKPPTMIEPGTRRIADIVAEIASDNGLTLAEIRRKTFAHAISHPRQYAYAVLLDAGFSSPAIARFFNVDHSTVLQGAIKARARQKPVDIAVDSVENSIPLLQFADEAGKMSGPGDATNVHPGPRHATPEQEVPVMSFDGHYTTRPDSGNPEPCANARSEG